MKLDPQCQKIVEMMAASGAPPLEQQTAVELRAGRVAAREGMLAMAGPEVAMARVVDRSIPGPGGELPIRFYYPTGTTSAPVLVYFHGGGWVIGSIAEWDRTCRSLAAASGCIIASVDYRLAPENKYPAAIEDAYAALQWVSNNAAALDADPARVAVGGDSAGGNLATVACLLARDRGGKQAVFQLLVYPVTDLNDSSPSMVEFANGPFLTKTAMDYFSAQYLRSAADGESPYVSPAKADVKGLPPAFVLTAGCDPLRDEGEAYAAKLKAAGINVQTKRYEGAIHAFFNMAGVVDLGRQAINDAGAALRVALKP